MRGSKRHFIKGSSKQWSTNFGGRLRRDACPFHLHHFEKRICLGLCNYVLVDGCVARSFLRALTLEMLKIVGSRSVSFAPALLVCTSCECIVQSFAHSPVYT